MAEKVVEEYYLCKHGHRHKTEDKADTCDQETELENQLGAIAANPDFENISSGYEDFEADDYEVNCEPCGARTIDQVQSVTIVSSGKIRFMDVYRRKSS